MPEPGHSRSSAWDARQAPFPDFTPTSPLTAATIATGVSAVAGVAVAARGATSATSVATRMKYAAARIEVDEFNHPREEPYRAGIARYGKSTHRGFRYVSCCGG